MVRFTYTLDKRSPVPLYHQLKDVVHKEIGNGNWVADNLIPTELEIMDIFDISRTTVRQALTDLVKEFGAVIWDFIDGKQFLGGDSLNVAAHFSKLGAESYYLTRIGCDENGIAAQAQIERLGIKTQ